MLVAIPFLTEQYCFPFYSREHDNEAGGEQSSWVIQGDTGQVSVGLESG